MITIVETAQFLRASEKLLSEDDRFRLISLLAENPLVGDEIVGSGGLRKVRFAIGSRGKSGSSRVIYFYFNETTPLYLITCYAKSGKSNLTDAEVNKFAKVTALIKASARKEN